MGSFCCDLLLECGILIDFSSQLFSTKIGLLFKETLHQYKRLIKFNTLGSGCHRAVYIAP